MEIDGQNHFIADHLGQYLDTTRLSMSQVAKRWGVSTALLSQIKNNKKLPGVDLGLKILRETNASLETREKWIKGYYKDSSEVAQVYYDIENQRKEIQLQESFSERLESDPLLVDIFLDISHMGEQGLSTQTIIREYGKYGIEKTQVLMNVGLVELFEGRFRKVIRDIPYLFTPQSSFQYIKNVMGDLGERYKADEFRGEFNFEINDLSEEAYLELKQLHKEYLARVIKVSKENEMARVKGGKRVLVQLLTTMLKCFVFIFIVQMSDPSFAGDGNGLAGGASGLLRQDQLGVFKRFITIDPLMYHGKGSPPSNSRVIIRGHKYDIDYVKGGIATVEYLNERDAVQTSVALNRLLSNWQIEEDAFRSVLNGKFPMNCDFEKIISYRDLDVNTPKVYPVGFKVEKVYTPNGEVRYKGLNHFYFPCKENK